MIRKQSNTDQKYYTGIIRENHFKLYEILIQYCLFSEIKEPHFSGICTNGMEWPNMIYNFNFSGIKPDVLLTGLSHKMKNEKWPDLLIIDSMAKPEGFDFKAREAGLLPVMRWKGMVCTPAAKQIKTEIPPGFEIVQVNKFDQLTEWIQILNMNFFRKKALDPDVFRPLLNTDDIIILLGLFHKKPVSTLLLNNHRDSTGMYLASTLPEFSGRGFMSAMINYTIDYARDQAIKYIILEATNESARLYSRYGFQEICNFDIFWKSQENE